MHSLLVPAVIPDFADNWSCCAAGRRLFEIRAVAAIFVVVPGSHLRPGYFLQSPCYHRDFERLALFTATLIVICIEIWPRLTLHLPSANLCLCLFCETTAHCSQSLRSPCVALQVQYCWLPYRVVLVPPMFPSQSASYALAVVINLQWLHCTWYARDCILSGTYSVLWHCFTEWFLILHAADHKVSHFTKHLMWNFRFTDFQTSVDIRIGLNARSFPDLNQSFWIEVVCC